MYKRQDEYLGRGDLGRDGDIVYVAQAQQIHFIGLMGLRADRVSEQGELRREEACLLLVGRLLERCGGCPRPPEEVRPEVRAVCDYLEAHCDRRITLEQLCEKSDYRKMSSQMLRKS